MSRTSLLLLEPTKGVSILAAAGVDNRESDLAVAAELSAADLPTLREPGFVKKRLSC